MQIELACPCCGSNFVHETAHDHRGDAEVLTVRLLHDALGDGGTVEDALHTALADRDIHCPECDARVPVDEEDLSRLAQTMMASW